MRRVSVAALLAVIGCAESVEKLRPQGHDAPETFLTSGPPDSTSATSYRVHFFWYGIDPDPDGSIDHFEYVIVDHPSANAPHDSAIANTLGIAVPTVDDPRWTRTEATDSTFVTSADSLHRDPRPGPGETPGDVLDEFFERWHTFFIRAVDDRGLPDPTPEHRSFNARTLAPTVWLKPPVQPGQTFYAPPSVTLHWDGADPIDEFQWQAPDSSRWLHMTSHFDPDDPDTFVSFPESLYALPARFDWSPWRAWDAEDGAGRSATFTDLARTGDFPGSGYHIFAVQAKDEAGAVTPVFDWRSPQHNNVALLRASNAIGPYLWVQEAGLGTHRFARGSRPIEVLAVAGAPLDFKWRGDASCYGGTVDAYRFGWNLVNPSDDDEWDRGWDPNATSTQRVLSEGGHRLYVEARDNGGLVVRGVLLIEAHAFTKQRALLFVDDADERSGDAEADADARWLAALSTVATEAGLEFLPTRDIFDVEDQRGVPPPVDLLFDYELVVWYSLAGPGRRSALRGLGQFGGPWLPCPRSRCPGSFNGLKAYIDAGGKLWVSGFRPARQLWTDARDPENPFGPVNVATWRDPYGLCRGVDSLGTSSLLYELGVEMFDVGAAVDSPRRAIEHYCQGFAVALPGAPALDVDPLRWPTPEQQPMGLAGRANIEIYNMPAAMLQQQPPLLPPLWRTTAPYTYVSGVRAEPPSAYPHTADQQAVLILTKARQNDARPSRAICGFSPHLLTLESQTRLVGYVLVDQMGLGTAQP